MKNQTEQKVRYPVAGKVQVCKTVDEAMRQLIAGDSLGDSVSPVRGKMCGFHSTSLERNQDEVNMALKERRGDIKRLLLWRGQVKVGSDQSL